MATVYLHIGAPKTATSTLQTVFSKNYKKLLKDGVLYPQAARHGDAHHLLICDLIEKHQDHRMADFWYGDCARGKAWEELKTDLHTYKDRVHSVVLSSELFFGQSKNIGAMHKDILTHLEGHTIKIVVYLRRQDQMYSSFFNQDVKGVRQWAHSAYQFYDTHQVFEHHYLKSLRIWSDSFGKENIIIRPYESQQWPEGDIVKDFCALLGTISLKSGRASSNSGLGIHQLYLKQCLNRVGFDKGENEAVVEQLMRLCPEEPTPQCSYVKKRRYRQLRRDWVHVNRRLEEEFLGTKTLFQQEIPLAHQVVIYETDKQVIAQFLRIIVDNIVQGGLAKHSGLFAKAALLVLAEQDLWSILEPDARAALLASI
ncbi:MAG: hypothetical protein AB8B81_00040 [Halioglobus sp.]